MVNDSRLKIFESTGIKKNASWLLKKFDLFGNKFTFEEDDNQSFRTNIGGFISLLLIITISVLGFIFGVEIYQRKQPTVSTSQEVLDYSKVMLEEFPIMFSFITSYWISDYSKYLSVSSYMLERSTEDTRFIFFNNLEPCTLDRFIGRPPKIYSAIKDLLKLKEQQEEYMFCLPQNDNIYFQNAMGTSNDTYITTNIKTCSRNCAENLENFISSMIMKIYYLDSYVDPKNFTDPENYYFGTYYSKVAPGFNKAIYVSVSRNILKSDNGWIMEDIKDTEYISLKSIKTDVSVSTSNLVTVYIDSPQFRQKVNRSYTTVQDVLAKVGGLFNGFLMIIQVLLYHYTRFKYISSVFESTWLNKVVDSITIEREASKYNIKMKANKLSLGIMKNNNPTSGIKVNQEKELKNDQVEIDIIDNRSNNKENHQDTVNINLPEIKKNEDSKMSISEYIKSNESSCYNSDSDNSDNSENHSQIEVTPKPNSTANVNCGLRKHFFPSLKDIAEDNKENFESRIDYNNQQSNNAKSILYKNRTKIVDTNSVNQNTLVVIGETTINNSFLISTPQKTKYPQGICDDLNNTLNLNDNSNIGIFKPDIFKNNSKMSYSSTDTKDNTKFGSLLSNQLVNPSSSYNLNYSKINNMKNSANSIQDLSNNENTNNKIGIINSNSNNKLSKFIRSNQVNQSDLNKSGLNSSLINLNNNKNILNDNSNNGKCINKFNNSISNNNNTIYNNINTKNNLNSIVVEGGAESIIKKLNSADAHKFKNIDLHKSDRLNHNTKNNAINAIDSISENIFTNFKSTPKLIALEDLYFDLIVEKFHNLNNYWHYLTSIFCCCSRYPFRVYDFIYSKAYLTVSFYYYSKKSFDYEWDKDEINILKESIRLYKKSNTSNKAKNNNDNNI